MKTRTFLRALLLGQGALLLILTLFAGVSEAGQVTCYATCPDGEYAACGCTGHNCRCNAADIGKCWATCEDGCRDENECEGPIVF